ncbi:MULTISPECIES: tail fiber assembly protein [Pseudomonas]|uniref:Phage tail protein n=1 Tax=Pseudomonas piscis TaxID=2614538 RepID=U6ZU91_9PSED|nr:MULTISPECIES: tail fiber assembly protein [Pseudomonas]AZC16695.1 hypothetical protein C4K40_1283 [Pseudomonas sp. CMR5c]ERO62005.1 hypothetical protein P308_06275 [Pseudomonas piscis]MQA52611.1 phage tail protein [Pseudomonas piscis]
MSKYFLAQTLGFLCSDEHEPALLEQAVKITDLEYQKLFEGQAQGRAIAADELGRPILVERPGPSAETLALIERAWRDGQLQETDGVVARHRDELDAGGATSLSAAQFQSLQDYRRLLRQWPAQDDFPASDKRPVQVMPAPAAAPAVKRTRARKPAQPAPDAAS